MQCNAWFIIIVICKSWFKLINESSPIKIVGGYTDFSYNQIYNWTNMSWNCTAYFSDAWALLLTERVIVLCSVYAAHLCSFNYKSDYSRTSKPCIKKTLQGGIKIKAKLKCQVETDLKKRLRLKLVIWSISFDWCLISGLRVIFLRNLIILKDDYNFLNLWFSNTKWQLHHYLTI